MSRHFLINGYNVVYRMERLVGRSLEDSRKGLLTWLAEDRPQGSVANRVTVVFDGRDDVFWPQDSGEFRVLFSRGVKADDLIKELIEDDPAPRTLILVTDDRDLRIFAGRMGVDSWAVDQFAACGRAERARSRRKSGNSNEASTEGKTISEVFKSRVNHELERLWLDRGKDR